MKPTAKKELLYSKKANAAKTRTIKKSAAAENAEKESKKSAAKTAKTTHFPTLWKLARTLIAAALASRSIDV